MNQLVEPVPFRILRTLVLQYSSVPEQTQSSFEWNQKCVGKGGVAGINTVELKQYFVVLVLAV